MSSGVVNDNGAIIIIELNITIIIHTVLFI